MAYYNKLNEIAHSRLLGVLGSQEAYENLSIENPTLFNTMLADEVSNIKVEVLQYNNEQLARQQAEQKQRELLSVRQQAMIEAQNHFRDTEADKIAWKKVSSMPPIIAKTVLQQLATDPEAYIAFMKTCEAEVQSPAQPVVQPAVQQPAPPHSLTSGYVPQQQTQQKSIQSYDKQAVVNGTYEDKLKYTQAAIAAGLF